MDPLNILQFSSGAGGAGSSMASMFSLGGAGFNIAGAGLGAAGSIVQSEGVAAGDQFQAEQADVAAQYGELKAVQTGAQMSRNLNTTLGNIDAIRAAAHTDPSSPTGAAYRDTQETIGTENKTIDVSNIMAQTQQDEADAAYYRTAASTALLGGDLGAAGQLLGAVGKGAAALAPILAA